MGVKDSHSLIYFLDKYSCRNNLEFIFPEPLSEDIMDFLSGTLYIFYIECKYGIIAISFKDKAGAMEFKLRFYDV